MSILIGVMTGTNAWGWVNENGLPFVEKKVMGSGCRRRFRNWTLQVSSFKPNDGSNGVHHRPLSVTS